MEPPIKGDWGSVSLKELTGAFAVSAFIGVVRMLYMIRKGRKFMWFDLMLEPCLAVMGGMMVWGLTEVTSAPDVVQGVLTSLGAWGGPRTIQWLETKYFPDVRK